MVLTNCMQLVRRQVAAIPTGIRLTVPGFVHQQCYNFLKVCSPAVFLGGFHYCITATGCACQYSLRCVGLVALDNLVTYDSLQGLLRLTDVAVH